MTKSKGTALQQWSLGCAAAATEKGQSSTVALLHFKNKAHQFCKKWGTFFNGFQVMSQHHSPKDTKGRSRNVCENSTTELHWHSCYPSLPSEGQEQERLHSEEGTGLNSLLQWICYSFSFFLILFMCSQEYTPSAIICFPFFRQGPLRGSVPAWSYSAFAKISQQNWFGDLQLLRVRSWIILLKSVPQKEPLCISFA